MPSQQPPPPPSLFFYSPKHMFTAGPLIQNSTKRGQSSQQVIYCRGAAMPHTPHLLSKMSPNPPLCNTRSVSSFSYDKGLMYMHNFSVLTLLVPKMKLMGIRGATGQ